MKRFVILGAGVAGKRAAQRIRKHEPGSEIVVVDEQGDSFYYKPMLGAFLSGRVGEAGVVSRDRDLLAATGARLLAGVRVTALDACARELALDNGERVAFDSLLVACGTRVQHPVGGGENVSGVFTLDTLDDARGLIRSLSRARRAVVFGAGLSGVSALIGLRERGLACTLLLPEERFWPGTLDPVASSIVEERLTREGTVLVKQSGVERLVLQGDRLAGLVTTRGEELATDLLVVAAPRVPATECLAGTGLAGQGGVEVDASLRTRLDGIYAAGDVALHPPWSGGEAAAHPGWLSAWVQGAVAGATMCGGEARYIGMPALRTRILDLDVVCLGYSDADPATVREDSGDYPFEELPYIYKKIVYRDRRVVGAVFVGDVSEAGRVGQWVRKGTPEDECDRGVLAQMFQTRITTIQTIGALCPVCKHQMQLEDSCQDGDVATCPACGVDFRLERMPNGVFRAAFL